MGLDGEMKAKQTELYKILLYKSQQVVFGPCKSARVKFTSQDYEKPYRFDIALRFMVLAVFFFEVLFTTIDLFVTELMMSENETMASMSALE